VGVCRGGGVGGVAGRPGGGWRSTFLDAPVADAGGVRIGSAFSGEAERLRVAIPGARVHADLREAVRWPRTWPGTGPAGLLPGMRQYWLPHVLRAQAEGFVEVDERWALEGATAYAERNWGNGFPPVWWWGEAHDFGGDDVQFTAFGPGGLSLASEEE
jgi:tocopherol cyclase